MPQTTLTPAGTLSSAGNAVMTFNNAAIVAGASTPQWIAVWGNHTRGKANPPVVDIGGLTCRFGFSTRERANVATIARLRSGVVSEASARAICERNGLRYVAWGDIAALRRAPREGRVFRDVAYCPPSVAGAVAGVVLDWEAGDGRTATETERMIRRFADECPVPIALYTNAVGSPGYGSSGMDGTERRLINAAPYRSIMATRGVRALAAQIAPFDADHRVYVTFDLTMPLATAQAVRSFVIQRGLAGVNIWRNSASLETEASRAKMAVLEDVVA